MGSVVLQAASGGRRLSYPHSWIIRDTKRTDFYLDAKKAQEYGLIDGIVEG